MVATNPPPNNDNIADVISGLWELTVDYAKQETVEPLKGLGRYLGAGLAGALGVGMGLVMIVLAILRAVQTQTGSALTGNWTFVPYLVVIIAGGILIGLLAMKIKGPKDEHTANAGKELR